MWERLRRRSDISTPAANPHRLVVAVIAAAFAVAAFVAHAELAFRLNQTGALDQYNVFFNADTQTRLEAFSEGRHLGVKHPNLMPMVTPMTRFVARGLSALGLVQADGVELRRTIALLVVPAASGVKAAVLYLFFLGCGASLARSILLTGLGIASFSNVVFGTIPESYGLTGLCLALAFALAVWRYPGRPAVYWWLWLTVAFVAMGVTIVNIVPVAILFTMVQSSDGLTLRRAVARGAILVVLATAITAGSSYVLDKLLVAPAPAATLGAGAGSSDRGAAPARLRGTAESGLLARLSAPLSVNARHYLREGQLRRLPEHPMALTATFAPVSINVIPNTLAAAYGSKYRIEFIVDGKDSSILVRLAVAMAVLGTVALGLFAGTRAGGRRRALALASAAILGFSAVISFYGPNLYLYSQNWQLATLTPVALILTTGRNKRLKTIGLTLALAAVVIQDTRLLSDMFELLAAQA